MSTNLPAIIVLTPLVGAFVIAGLCWVDRRLCWPIALVSLGVSTLASLDLLLMVGETGVVEYHMAGWEPPWGIGYRVDLLSGLLLVVIGVVALLNLVASRASSQEELPDKEGVYHALYLLFVSGLLGLVITGDLFNLYVLLEVTSLTSYALIAMGPPDRAPLASLHYVILGVVGASFYLLGVGYLYIMTGSLNMMDVASLLQGLGSSQAVLVGFVFCLVGVWIKMGLFPLHVWLPNAYTYAPVSVSRVIAPLMTKVMVYVMIRLMLTVFGLDYVLERLDLSQMVIWLSSLAILAGAAMALAQRDVKRMLTYIIVSEIGYMVGGVWLGNLHGMSGAVLHIVNDAFMTFCLFLAVGNVAYRLHGTRMEDFRGLFASMPVTMACFILGMLSIAGVPPTCGFFSKWYLLLGALEAGQYVFLVALILSSLICALILFRIVELTFFNHLGSEAEAGGGGHGHQAAALNEAPVPMLLPLGLVSLGLIGLGLATGVIMRQIVVPFLT